MTDLRHKPFDQKEWEIRQNQQIFGLGQADRGAVIFSRPEKVKTETGKTKKQFVLYHMPPFPAPS